MTTRRWIMPSLLALVMLLAIASIVVGRIVLGWNVWLDQDAIGRTILLELRLPRALLGIAIGAALGLAGAAMQATCATRSPIPARSASRRWRRSARC
jgi:iron complex transport system permease protein